MLDRPPSPVYNSLEIISAFEVIIINKQSYMAELSKLLGFMSAWDRKDTLEKYEAIIDASPDFEELVASLGTPTKLAIELAQSYVPTPAPEVIPVEEEAAAEVPQEDFPEIPAAGEGEASPYLITEDEPEEEIAPEFETFPERPARKVRFFGLLASILFTIIIGIPIAIILICIGLPFVVGGLGLGAGVIWGALAAIPMLALFSDILAVLGVGLVLLAIALLLFWFGLWLSFELGYLWIGGVILRLGRALTYKKEVSAE